MSDFDKCLEAATSHYLVEPDWASILNICDSISQQDVPAEYAVSAIRKKLYARNPRVALNAFHVLETVIKNCGTPVHNEIASKEFKEELRELYKTTPHETLKAKTLELYQTWAHSFLQEPSSAQNSAVPTSSGKTEQELGEEELQLAIALSKSEAEMKEKASSISNVNLIDGVNPEKLIGENEKLRALLKEKESRFIELETLNRLSSQRIMESEQKLKHFQEKQAATSLGADLCQQMVPTRMNWEEVGDVTTSKMLSSESGPEEEEERSESNGEEESGSEDEEQMESKRRKSNKDNKRRRRGTSNF